MTSQRPSRSSGSLDIRLTQAPPGPLAWITGAILFAFGTCGLVADYYVAILAKQSPHTTHIAIYASIAVVGVLVPLGRYVFPVLAKVSVIVGDYIPGGRRRYDPPANPPGVAAVVVIPPTHPGVEDVEMPPPEKRG